MSGSRPAVVICADLAGGERIDAAAAAVAVAAAARADEREAGTMLLDLRPGARAPRGTLLAAAAARDLEGACRRAGGLRGAARGRICRAAPGDPEPGTGDGPEEPAEVLERASAELGAGILFALAEPADLLRLLRAVRGDGVLVSADRRAPRPLLALLAAELHADGVPLKVWTAPVGLVQARRTLAGLEAGGASGRRAARFAGPLTGDLSSGGPPRFAVAPAPRSGLGAERAQALPAVLAVALLTVVAALAVVALGGAATAKGRFQRAADLAAISGARSMRDDFARLFLPATLPGGAPNPAHLERDEYLRRARGAAREAARRNGLDSRLLTISFPDRVSIAPMRIGVRARGRIRVGRPDSVASGGSTSVRARARIALPLGFAGAAARPATASGGGYSGPLAYRQGEPMRPDVAAAFDRMAAAARAAGVALTINSGYRSDAEQRRLWEQNPDPRMVARPGTSLHRCGTELDLGPSSAYGWLAAHAGRFGFVQRYSWEAWHYGFVRGPEPCSAASERLAGAGDGRSSGSGGLPGFVPARYRHPLLAAASRRGVSAALLAAQLMAESGFNPNAVSSAGAQGIAQFMPATAAAYGLDDPFDAPAAIDAQARLMASLLGRFGSVSLALAAYNAGPAPVLDCDCVPPYPETQAYVARIMGLLGGAGALGIAPPGLEVRLVA